MRQNANANSKNLTLQSGEAVWESQGEDAEI